MNGEVRSWRFKILENENAVPFAKNPMRIRTETEVDLNRVDDKARNILSAWANERYARYEIMDKEWFHIVEVCYIKGGEYPRRFTLPNAYLVSYEESYSEDNETFIATIVVEQVHNLPQNVRVNKTWIDYEAEDAAWMKERSQPMPTDFLVTGAVALPNIVQKIVPQAIPKAKTFLEKAMKNIGLPFSFTGKQTRSIHRHVESMANGGIHVGNTPLSHVEALRLIEELKRTGAMIIDPATGRYFLKDDSLLDEQLEREARRHRVFKCEDATEAMARLIGRYGKKSEKIIIEFHNETGNGFVISISRNPNEAISLNGKHMGLLYKGVVRCNIHPAGLPEREWINDFAGVGKRTITRIPM